MPYARVAMTTSDLSEADELARDLVRTDFDAVTRAELRAKREGELVVVYRDGEEVESYRRDDLEAAEDEAAVVDARFSPSYDFG